MFKTYDKPTEFSLTSKISVSSKYLLRDFKCDVPRFERSPRDIRMLYIYAF